MKYAEKYLNFFFVIGSTTQREQFMKSDTLIFTSSQVNVVNGDKDEICGKITFKAEIQ